MNHTLYKQQLFDLHIVWKKRIRIVTIIISITIRKKKNEGEDNDGMKKTKNKMTKTITPDEYHILRLCILFQFIFAGFCICPW
jgi:hypothetical protein